RPALPRHLPAARPDAWRRSAGRGLGARGVFGAAQVTRPGPGAPAAPDLPLAVRPSEDELAALHAAVPPQPRRLAGVLVGMREPAGWAGPGRAADHTDAIGAVLRVANAVGVEVGLSADDHAPWHPGRCARVTLPDGTLLGHAGELHPQVLDRLELPARTVAFEIDVDALLAAAPREPVEAVPVSS